MPNPEVGHETLQESLDALVAAGLVERIDVRHGDPVYALTVVGAEALARHQDWKCVDASSNDEIRTLHDNPNRNRFVVALVIGVGDERHQVPSPEAALLNVLLAMHS